MSGVRHRGAVCVVLLAWLWCSAGWAMAAVSPLPASPTPHYIRDDAKWLSPAAYQALDAKLQAYERDTSSQFVVGIFPNIPEGAELFDFSQRLFEAWKPGTAGKDNGAIFLIFAAERQMRIHTGFGMEGVLPDARCKQIIQDRVAPLLRQGNRAAAVNAGVDAMIAAAKGEYTGTGKTRLDNQAHGNPRGWLPILIFILLIAFNVIPRILSRAAGAGWGGGGFIGGGSAGGGWSGGGGGFSGGGDSGGGFSGGGGDSGGGGASGGW